MKKLFLPFLLVATFGTSSFADDAEQHSRDLLNRWRSSKKQPLHKTVDPKVVAGLKAAANKGDDDARAFLVQLGDQETTLQCLKDLRAERDVRKRAILALETSARPDLVVALADDLNRPENSNSTKVETGLEIERTPAISVAAASIIRQIVAKSPEFTKAVRQWATDLQKNSHFDRNVIRSAVRIWFNQNERTLRAGQYHHVVPPHRVAPLPSPPAAKVWGK